jgi:hypothetical protein
LISALSVLAFGRNLNPNIATLILLVVLLMGTAAMTIDSFRTLRRL